MSGSKQPRYKDGELVILKDPCSFYWGEIVEIIGSRQVDDRIIYTYSYTKNGANVTGTVLEWFIGDDYEYHI